MGVGSVGFRVSGFGTDLSLRLKVRAGVPSGFVC